MRLSGKEKPGRGLSKRAFPGALRLFRFSVYAKGHPRLFPLPSSSLGALRLFRFSVYAKGHPRLFPLPSSSLGALRLFRFSVYAGGHLQGCFSCRAHPSEHYACSGFPFMPEGVRVAVFLLSSSLGTLRLFRFSVYARGHPRGCLSCRTHPSKHYACSGFPFMPEVIRVVSFLPGPSLETLRLFRFSVYAGGHPRGCLPCRAHLSEHYACSGFPFMPEVIRVAVFPAELIPRSITPVPVFRLCQRSSAWLSFLPSSSLETLHLFWFFCYAGEHPRDYLSCPERTAEKAECFAARFCFDAETRFAVSYRTSLRL